MTTPAQQAQPVPADATRRKRRFRRIRWLCARVRGLLALFALLQVVLICTPLTDGLYRWLDVTSPPAKSDAIVCLGGNEGRLLWTVDAYRRGFAPRIIVSNHPGAAQWMRHKLIQCGVPADRVLMDATSATTADHPAGVARLPEMDPTHQRFLLVTDHEHSRRAAACFHKAGFRHIAVYGSGFPLRTEGTFQMRCRWRLLALPRMAYECAALVQYWLEGRI